MFIPIAVLLIPVASLLNHLHLAAVEIQNRLAGKAFLSCTCRLSNLFHDCGVSLGGYSITKDKNFTDRFYEIERAISAELKDFRLLPARTPHQVNLKKQIERSAEEGWKTVTGAIPTIEKNDVQQLRARKLYKSIKSHAEQLEEDARLFNKSEVSAARRPEKSVQILGHANIILGAYLLAFILLGVFSHHAACSFTKEKLLSVSRLRIFCKGVWAVFVPLLIMTGLVLVLMEFDHWADVERRNLIRASEMIEHVRTRFRARLPSQAKHQRWLPLCDRTATSHAGG